MNDKLLTCRNPSCRAKRTQGPHQAAHAQRERAAVVSGEPSERVPIPARLEQLAAQAKSPQTTEKPDEDANMEDDEEDTETKPNYAE
eukprot:5126665-Alexandrium_andersonii.AAC.1